MSKNSFKYRFKNNLVEPSKYLDTYRYYKISKNNDYPIL